MKTTYRKNGQFAKVRNRRYGSRFALAILLAFSFVVFAQARPHFNPDGWRMREASTGYTSTHDMNVTIATIRVRVKLHNFLYSEAYSVQCEVYDRPHGSLRRRGDGASDYVSPPSNGEVNTLVAVTIHPLKRVSASSPLLTWMCHLNIVGKGVGSRLRSKADSRAPFRANVGGRF